MGQKRESFYKAIFGRLTHFARLDFLPLGFAQMVLVDGRGLDRANYDFKFVRREFLGDVRTIVVDVTPQPNSGYGRFVGRIWIEDQDFNIVRFNGTYAPARNGVYLHLDSWRLNMAPGLWLPAYIYSEESDLKFNAFHELRFKSQTRLWGYDATAINKESEFSQIMVDAADAVKDQSESVQELSPVSNQRAWERQAEDNVIDRLQRASLLDTPGEVDKVLQTVVNNIEITNNLT